MAKYLRRYAKIVRRRRIQPEQASVKRGCTLNRLQTARSRIFSGSAATADQQMLDALCMTLRSAINGQTIPARPWCTE